MSNRDMLHPTEVAGLEQDYAASMDRAIDAAAKSQTLVGRVKNALMGAVGEPDVAQLTKNADNVRATIEDGTPKQE